MKQFNKDSFETVIKLAKNRGLTKEDILIIVQALADSGEKLVRNVGSFVDIPSTGGPSSLSTLICPYILVECGEKVPKLGVKGRPAGGIDVLAQISDYKIHLSSKEILNIIASCGYCHFIADSNLTPLDADFFRYRTINNAKAIPELVIASILSKKIAVGVNKVGLDLRYFVGANFGNTFEEAYKNANLFIEIAQELDIKAKVFISNLNNPLQPFIGRGEALLALRDIFENKMNPWLNEHFNDCMKMAFCLVEDTSKFNPTNLVSHFEKNLIAQGSSIKSFWNVIERIDGEERVIIHSDKNGFVRIDMVKIRDIIVKYQDSNEVVEFADDVGLILLKKNLEYIQKGENLASLRIGAVINKEVLINEIKAAFTIEDRFVEFDSKNILTL